MPLSKNKQKILNSLLRMIISEINYDSKQEDVLILPYIKLAAGLPNEVTDEIFNQQVSALDEVLRNKLSELRDLYLNKNSLLNAESDAEEIKKAVQQYLAHYEKLLLAEKASSKDESDSKLNVSQTSDSPLKELVSQLHLKPGDIIISEMPFQDSMQKEFLNFRGFIPCHASVWTGDKFEKPFAHSVREGYRPPGLKLSSIWDGRHLVFRYKTDPLSAGQAASIIRVWASAETLYSKEKYERVYPLRFWDRHKNDLVNYFGEHASAREVAGPSTPFGEPRASYDLMDLQRNKNLAQMGGEGLRRALKFAAHRGLESEAVSKKGQRCTPIVTAAFQASILAPLVVAKSTKQPFRQFKGKSLLEYADQILIPNWQKTDLGKLLLKAITTNDYSAIFPAPFNLDQRYATPENLYSSLKKTKEFEQIGGFSCFKNKLVLIEKGQMEEPTQFLSIKL